MPSSASPRPAAEVALVAGPAGAGKSTLVQACRTRLWRGTGFLSGKFDQKQRDAPTRPSCRHSRADARRILARAKPLLPAGAMPSSSARTNTRLVADLVPRWRSRRQAAAARRSCRATRTEPIRCGASILRGVVARQEHPLVLSSTICNGVDPATLRFLERLAPRRSRSSPARRGYRDDDLTRTSPLASGLESIRGSEEPFSSSPFLC